MAGYKEFRCIHYTAGINLLQTWAHGHIVVSSCIEEHRLFQSSRSLRQKKYHGIT